MREELCSIIHLLAERGLVSGTDGNISVRLGEDSMLITPSGVNKGLIQPNQLIEQRFDGTVVAGTGKPTKESSMHSRIYKMRPEVNAVIHTHPAAATAFAVCGRTLPTNCLVEVSAVIGNMGLAEYAPAGSEALAETVEQEARDNDVIFMKNHGIITCGKNLVAAFNKMDAVENAAKTIICAKIIGGIQEIS